MDSTEGERTQVAEPLIYWAVVLQHRWWCWFDGIERHRAAQDGLDGPAVRRIAKAYAVARGLSIKQPRGPDGKKLKVPAAENEAALAQRAADIAQLLSATAKIWEGDLLARYMLCVGVVGEAKEKKLFDRDQISAVTKLMWFLKPDGWTMFDDRAATGLGISVGNAKSEPRAKRFYAELQHKGFADVTGRVKAELLAAGLAIPPERVLDLYLMLRAEEADLHDKNPAATLGSVVTAKAYLDVIEEPLRSRVRGAAARVAKAVPNPFGLEAA